MVARSPTCTPGKMSSTWSARCLSTCWPHCCCACRTRGTVQGRWWLVPFQFRACGRRDLTAHQRSSEACENHHHHPLQGEEEEEEEGEGEEEEEEEGEEEEEEEERMRKRKRNRKNRKTSRERGKRPHLSVTRETSSTLRHHQQHCQQPWSDLVWVRLWSLACVTPQSTVDQAVCARWLGASERGTLSLLSHVEASWRGCR